MQQLAWKISGGVVQLRGVDNFNVYPTPPLPGSGKVGMSFRETLQGCHLTTISCSFVTVFHFPAELMKKSDIVLAFKVIISSSHLGIACCFAKASLQITTQVRARSVVDLSFQASSISGSFGLLYSMCHTISSLTLQRRFSTRTFSFGTLYVKVIETPADLLWGCWLLTWKSRSVSASCPIKRASAAANSAALLLGTGTLLPSLRFGAKRWSKAEGHALESTSRAADGHLHLHFPFWNNLVLKCSPITLTLCSKRWNLLCLNAHDWLITCYQSLHTWLFRLQSCCVSWRRVPLTTGILISCIPASDVSTVRFCLVPCEAPAMVREAPDFNSSVLRDSTR